MRRRKSGNSSAAADADADADTSGDEGEMARPSSPRSNNGFRKNVAGNSPMTAQRTHTGSFSSGSGGGNGYSDSKSMRNSTTNGSWPVDKRQGFRPATLSGTDGRDNESSSAYETDSRPTGPEGSNSHGTDAPVKLLADESAPKKWRNWWIRTFWTLVMVSGFIGILMAGHIWVVLLVVVLQTLVYKEVISIAHIPSKQKRLPWFRTMNWYFLLSTNYFLYGQTIIQYFKQSIFVDALGVYLATHHQFISFILYVIGFVAFVMNLQKGHYKFQFTQFAWTHMTLLLVVVQSQFFVKNIFEGLVWFILPTSLVIVNDIAAYIAGFFFGRTPLIRLSPKKTWEGFIGALFISVIYAFFVAGVLSRYPYLTCPVRNMKTSSFSGVTCNQNPVFLPMDFRLSPALVSLLWHVTGTEIGTITITPFQLHAIVMALFASLIAPFGGFFASGAKRAFKLKDFGDSIPGHGGITDRMDCQFLMSFFGYMYYQAFICASDITVGQILQMAVAGLSTKDQLELFYDLRDFLVQQGRLDLSDGGTMAARRPLLSRP